MSNSSGKKGKRKKGNTTMGPKSRPSLPSMPGGSSSSFPPSAPAASSSSSARGAVVSSSQALQTPQAGQASPSTSVTPPGNGGAVSARASSSSSHGEVLVAKAPESSAAEALAATPLPAPVVAPDVAPRNDNQEESGPRIVAFAPTKTPETEAVATPAVAVTASVAAPLGVVAKTAKKAAKADRKTDKSAAASVSRASTASTASTASAIAEGAPISLAPVSHPELDAHESFFAAGVLADKEHRAVARGVTSVDHDHDHDEDLAAKHKMSPAVRERRARFTKYVKWAVGASAIVCLAAVVRVTVARGQHPAEHMTGGSQAAEIAAPLDVNPALPPAPTPASDTAPSNAATPNGAQAAPAPVPAPDPQAAAAAADPSAVTTTAATAPGAAPDVAPASTPAPGAATTAAAGTAAGGAAPDVTPDPAAAKVEKAAARKSLERGDLKGAIEAGERSVALDPTDGDAWLLLGAAYQEKGKAVDARRAFNACIKQGKRGAVGECAAMLR